MAFRVIVAGVPIECDTVDEAVEIARKAGGNGASSRRAATGETDTDASTSRWTDARVREFMKRVEGNQRKVIEALIEHRDGRTDGQLRQLLGVPSNREVAGILSGLWKNAKRVGAEPTDVYERKRVNIGGQGAYEYTLRDSFRRAWSRVQSE